MTVVTFDASCALCAVGVQVTIAKKLGAIRSNEARLAMASWAAGYACGRGSTKGLTPTLCTECFARVSKSCLTIDEEIERRRAAKEGQSP